MSLNETDQELLDLAAKAVGYAPGVDLSGNLRIEQQGMGVGLVEWNPLDNDSQAMRLAADARANIAFGDGTYVVSVLNLSSTGNLGADPNAAIRRAIVRTVVEANRR